MSAPDEFSKEIHDVLNPLLSKALLLRPEMMKDEASFLEMDITEAQRQKLVELIEQNTSYKPEGAEATTMTNVRTVFDWYKAKEEDSKA